MFEFERILNRKFSRREFLRTSSKGLFSLWLASQFPFFLSKVSEASINLPLILKTIPQTGEKIPAIGMGTWLTFDVGSSPVIRDNRAEVLQTFFDLGGGMIDSSPMYGSAESVLGTCFEKTGYPESLFSATKVWHMIESFGKSQIEDSFDKWGIKQFDLFQIHNLLAWEKYLPYLRELKEKKRIRYLGITTSHGRRHQDLLAIMRNEPLDFIQVTYNITHREVENKILPLALERQMAVIANRPLDGGYLMDRYEGKPLPEWANELDIKYWSQFFLKFIISHPVITCAIPATSQVEHMKENMGACYGKLPSKAQREQMIRHLSRI